MNAYVAHANRNVFGPDADEFRPERWLGDQETVTQMDQYFLSVSRVFPLTPNPVGLRRSLSLLMFSVPVRRLVWTWPPKLCGEKHRSCDAQYADTRARVAV